ncbi:MAG: nucleotidyltransferase family protein [Candidatus Baldrarchaeia archaeon]|mgnify:CR=1 FL=1
MVKGVVLCGGKGTRLRPLTYYFQKTMIPIGPKQKPLLEYIVRLFKYHGIEDLLFLVNYKAEQILNYFDDGSRFGVRIEYIRDDPSLSGTGGALINAFRKGYFDKNKDIIVYYGDILSNIDLSDMLRFHREKNALITIGLARGFKVRVGVADIGEDGIVRNFIEKPVLEKPVSIGIYVLSCNIFDMLEDLPSKKEEIDLSGDVIPHFLKSGRVFGYVSDCFWYDVGSIERYEKLDNKTIERELGFLFK